MISSNVSSIMSNQSWMNNNANNVANVNTDRFVPQNTTISETQNGGTKANTEMASSNGSEQSQTDLSKELTDQTTIEKTTQANVQAIRTQNEMFGSLLDIRG
jgi:flagellar hook protein FlgE